MRILPRGLLLAGLLIAPLLVYGQPASEAQRLVFLLQYIGVDYPEAVRDGAIADAFEYREMQEFSELLVDRFDVLHASGASEDLRGELVELRDAITRMEPPSEVRSRSARLVDRLIETTDAVTLPAVAPSLERGRRYYDEGCTPCHGTAGGGDGRAAEHLEPPPSSFRDPRMNLLSPHQVHGATTFGIEGTAMPSYTGALTDEAIWDVAFYVMTLRDDFAPVAPERALPISLLELSTRSNDELLSALHETHPDTQPANLDYYRRNLPRAVQAQTVSPSEPVVAKVPDAPDLHVAVQLQGAFSGVAERVFPSVVGVTSFVRGDAPAGEQEEGEWREPLPEERLYPGFRQFRSGSGVVVSSDGYILTAAHVVTDAGGQAIDAIDIELSNGRHLIGRVVGTEPTLNLGVVQAEVYSRTRPPVYTPARIADSDTLKVGHWAIALGNPWGPGTTYSVGTISSVPERQCYQGDMSATLMQSSVRVAPGGYGGPLVNIEGEIIGLVLPPAAWDPDAPVRVAQASELALPINIAIGIYKALKVKETRESPWLGFSILELAAVRRGIVETPEGTTLSRTGVYIDDVYEPSPAAAADIRIGDCLVSVAGNRLFSVLDFQKWLYLSGIGNEVALEIYRDGEMIDKRVTIEKRPASAVPR